MKLVATKVEMETVGKMSKLVIENVDAIASDLTVLDSRLLLGNANIDVVALDGIGSLVLIAIDRASDEQLLLKAVEAYSWCLEYPEAVRRLYPAADVSVARPPRVMFVVERMSDSFHRKVKQLGFPEVDCVEVRHLAIDGAEAVHFDTVVRLRRSTVVSDDARPSPVGSPAPDNTALGASTGARATSLKLQKLLAADTPSRHAERPVIERPAAPAPVSAPAPAREPAVVVSMVNRTGRHAAARQEESALLNAPMTRRPGREAEPVMETVGTITLEPAATLAPVLEEIQAPQPTAVPEPVAVAPVLELVAEPAPIAAPEPIAAAPVIEPMIEPQPIAARALIEAVAPVLELMMEPTADAVPEPVVENTPVIELVVEPEPVAAPEPVVAAAPAIEPVVEAAPVVTAPEPPRISFADLSKELLAAQPAARKAVAVTKPVAPTRPLEPPVSIKPAAAAGGPERVSLADLSKELLGASAPVRTPQSSGPTPMRLQAPPAAEPPRVGAITRAILEQIDSVEAEPGAASPPLTVAGLAEAAAQTVPEPAAETAKTQSLPQAFDGLKFPGDGVLTRQWMDFLNQMTGTK
jgi:hypothetical protein